MQNIIALIYTIVILLYSLTCVFVIYHIFKYYLNPVIKIISIIFFAVVSFSILSTNLGIFYSIDWINFLKDIF